VCSAQKRKKKGDRFKENGEGEKGTPGLLMKKESRELVHVQKDQLAFGKTQGRGIASWLSKKDFRVSKRRAFARTGGGIVQSVVAEQKEVCSVAVY